jgi:hypothetical protein
MGRPYITDDKGEPVRDSDGNKQFHSDNDGDSKPDTKQTTYTDRGGLFGGGTTKNGSTYNPKEGKYNK